MKIVASTCLLLFVCSITRGAQPTPAAVLQELRSFDQMGSMLYVAAHPDDENTQLIAYLARGRNYRTAYLSLTRGDGGQNVLGPELGPELGVIRTQELLAARRLDGGQAILHPRPRFRFFQGLSPDPAGLGQGAGAVRHRARHPHVSPGRDGDALLHNSRPHARASYGFGDPGAGSV